MNKKLQMSVHISLVVAVGVTVGTMFMFPRQAKACPNQAENRVVVSYWGWDGVNGDICSVVCGPCPPSTKIVGQTIYECDGSITEWGRTDCTYDVRTTSYPCEICPPEGP